MHTSAPSPTTGNVRGIDIFKRVTERMAGDHDLERRRLLTRAPHFAAIDATLAELSKATGAPLIVTHASLGEGDPAKADIFINAEAPARHRNAVEAVIADASHGFAMPITSTAGDHTITWHKAQQWSLFITWAQPEAMEVAA